MPQHKDDPPPHVIEVSGGEWVKAARFINFPTGQHELRQAHKDWIDTDLRDILKRLKHPWVDLIGHASRRGDATKNKALSERRCNSVRARIEKLSSSVEFRFNVDIGTGESEAESYGKAESDNSGYDRSVDVKVFGARPTRKPEPLPPPDREPAGSRQWQIRLLVGGSAGKVLTGGAFLYEIYSGPIREPSGVTHEAAGFVYGTVGLEPDLPLPLPVPSISKGGPWSRFTTSKPVRIRAFEGQADLYQDPGVGTYVLPPIPGMPNIPISVGGDMHITFKSSALQNDGVFVHPRVVTIKSAEGIQIGLGGGGSGALKIVGKIRTRPV